MTLPHGTDRLSSQRKSGQAPQAKNLSTHGVKNFPAPWTKALTTQPARPAIIRLGVVTYVCALLLVAAFSIAFHFISDNIVHREQTTARIVNLSGRQRMLSQRIARLALERAAHTRFRSDAETQDALKDAIALMDFSHRKLRQGAPADGIVQQTSPEVLNVYSKEPYRLDARLAEFLAQARSLAGRPETQLTVGDPELAAVEIAAQGGLLNALNASTEAIAQTGEAAITHLRRVLAGLTVAMLLILLGEALFLYRPLFLRLERTHAELVELGRTDPLTGSLNRRAFTEAAAAVVFDAERQGEALAVLMLDIDRFKTINDRFGHAAGDQVINAVVASLLRNARAGSLLCRMGGEEFAILLRDCSLAQAGAVGEQLRLGVCERPVMLMPELAGIEIPVTVSCGTATLARGEDSIFPALGRADEALYRAKARGRNRVEQEGVAGPRVVSAVR